MYGELEDRSITVVQVRRFHCIVTALDSGPCIADSFLSRSNCLYWSMVIGFLKA